LFGFLCFGLNSLSKEDFSFFGADISKAINSEEALFVKPAINVLRDSPRMTLLEENSVMAIAPPALVDAQVLGTILGGVDAETDYGGNSVFEYLVQEGDTISSIAAKYNISEETILWANELTSKSIISPGQKLIILPVSGVLHYVKAGDTISGIAQTYKGDIAKIVEFNELTNESDIFVGDILIIPNGKMPSAPKTNYIAQVPLGSSYFICPHTGCHVTQGRHWYNAIDFGGKCGDPVVAAAGGTVQKIGYGWNGGGGNYIRIIHPNGVVTYYGHIQAALVSVGQQVSQGEIIALMGGKPGMRGAGLSTGCHVHFDVRGARNPFAR